MFEIKKIVRPSILNLRPYSSAREEYSSTAEVYLDANESPFNTDYNRYPDPMQKELKSILAKRKELNIENIFIGNGSDEAIDLLIRAFCEPGEDRIYSFPPTYGMYKVSAQINNVEFIEIPLNNSFRLPPIHEILDKIKATGLMFFCRPNNPTGVVYPLEIIQEIAIQYSGLVVVDEAYIDFSSSKSAISLIRDNPNIVVIQTMSKAYGLAGLRLGMAYANREVIQILNQIKPPYNVNSYSQKVGIAYLLNKAKHKTQIVQILKEKDKLSTNLSKIKIIEQVYHSETNFILVKCKHCNEVYSALKYSGIIVRNRSQQIKGCLRISVGTSHENELLLKTLKKIDEKESIIHR